MTRNKQMAQLLYSICSVQGSVGQQGDFLSCRTNEEIRAGGWRWGGTGSGEVWLSGLHLRAHSLLPSSTGDLGLSPPTFMQAKMETS